MSGRARLWCDGCAHASREAVERMYRQAEMMNDSEEKAILWVAADDLGHHFAAARDRLDAAATTRADG